MKAHILGQWEMELPELGDGNRKKWWLDWALASPKQAGDHIAVSYRTFLALHELYGPDAFPRIREYFGGIGAHALMLEELFNPMLWHTVADYAPEAVDHMKRVLRGYVDVVQRDAYDGAISWTADLHVLDFGDLTVFKAQPHLERGQLLERVFSTQPKAVTITDIAAPYLHLQKKSYEPLLGPGSCDSYETYLEAFSRLIEERFGYVLLEGHYTRWSCHMAFVPKGLTEHGSFYKLNKAIHGPGLELS